MKAQERKTTANLTRITPSRQKSHKTLPQPLITPLPERAVKYFFGGWSYFEVALTSSKPEKVSHTRSQIGDL